MIGQVDVNFKIEAVEAIYRYLTEIPDNAASGNFVCVQAGGRAVLLQRTWYFMYVVLVIPRRTYIQN